MTYSPAASTPLALKVDDQRPDHQSLRQPGVSVARIHTRRGLCIPPKPRNLGACRLMDVAEEPQPRRRARLPHGAAEARASHALASDASVEYAVRRLVRHEDVRRRDEAAEPALVEVRYQVEVELAHLHPRGSGGVHGAREGEFGGGRVMVPSEHEDGGVGLRGEPCVEAARRGGDLLRVAVGRPVAAVHQHVAVGQRRRAHLRLEAVRVGDDHQAHAPRPSHGRG
eukprot:CAMPEP_0195574688 /NCGR_PEP_ID=MMETSP0814-20130614/6109_1 /TAXON_ID=97485 /ORGANISM="Prymnesium parvum, Strain Texoma1" /LENGTH=225 /DNA_ID=CAMNT_0040710715 /DNA_START=659 /DNA_END=1332 /DNA_ORIENTATION=-